MKRLYCLRHVSFEGPGVIGAWADGRGVSLQIVCLFDGESLPYPESVDGLIIMGGPMSVYYEDRVPWLKEEKRFIRSVIDRGVPVIGICLGAQLIAQALGAEVYPNAEKEIGWWEVEKTEEGKGVALLNELPDRFPSFHWHGDTFNLPDGATHLLRSEACAHQAFVKDNALALQFHMEMSSPDIRELAERCAGELVEASFIQRGTGLENHPSMAFNHRALFTLLDRWILGSPTG